MNWKFDERERIVFVLRENQTVNVHQVGGYSAVFSLISWGLVPSQLGTQYYSEVPRIHMTKRHIWDELVSWYGLAEVVTQPAVAGWGENGNLVDIGYGSLSNFWTMDKISRRKVLKEMFGL